MIERILKYLELMEEKGASDLYLTVDAKPALRINNDLRPADDEVLSKKDLHDILSSLLTLRQLREFENQKELNTAIDMGERGRFRVNVLQQRQNTAIVVRRIVTKIPDFKELRLPPVFERLALLKQGLVLVTGMTGSGKTTTLASMINYRNTRMEGHIVTIEDPIEFYHNHLNSIITQREVGVDTESYAVALKNALRQRPDVILIGEIRSREVMEQALIAAETGHLCLATLHTNNAYQAIDRVLNFFPEDSHEQVRLNLSLNLRAVVAQRLLPSVSGDMVLACEVLLNEGYIKPLIHEGKIKDISKVMEQNTASGMQTFDESLLELYQNGLVTEETASSHADIPGDLKIKLRQKGRRGDSKEGGVFKSMDTTILSISE